MLRRHWTASIVTGVVLAVALHADWHLARPQHHDGLTLNWGANWAYHWLATGTVFAIVGAVIALKWPEQRWRIGATALAIAIVLAQVIDPVGEAAFFQHRLGYEGEPARWRAFWEALAASVPLYTAALWLSASRVPAQRLLDQ